MTNEELTELIGVSIDEELPEALRQAVERALAADPELARDTRALRAAVQALKALPAEKPDSWFVERALQGLFREHDAARDDSIASGRWPVASDQTHHRPHSTSHRLRRMT